MDAGVDSRPHVRDLPVATDEERDAVVAPQLLRYAVRRADLARIVGRERKGQLVLLLECLMALRGVARDADYCDVGLLEILPSVTERTCLGSAAGRLVLRVEVHDDLLAAERTQANLLAGGT